MGRFIYSGSLPPLTPVLQPPLTPVLQPPLTPTLSPLKCRQRGEGEVWR